VNREKCMSARFVISRFMDYSKISGIARLMLGHILHRESDVNHVAKATVTVMSQRCVAEVNVICLKLIQS
jgi:hypothetical protein